MGLFTRLAATIWRDFGTDGVPATGAHTPIKSEIRRWGAELESLLSNALSGSGLIYADRASLDADLAHDANSQAWVLGDVTVANNGIYRKSGASGTGAWSRVGDLPYSFVRATGGGTATAITATTTLPVASGAYAAVLLLDIPATSTGAATLSVNGGTARPLVTQASGAIGAGYMQAGQLVFVVDDGTSYRLVSDPNSTANAASAAASAAAASGSASAAAASSVTATAAAATATSSATAAVAAAEASGNVEIFDSHASATAALGSLVSGQVVEIYYDETRQGARTRYRVQSGVLVYKMTLGRSQLVGVKRGAQFLQRAARPILIVGLGQSNLLGSNNDTSGAWTTDADVLVWDWSIAPSGGWVTSEPGHYPPYGNSYVNANNALHQLAMRVHEETGQPVRVVARMQGSQSITDMLSTHLPFLDPEVVQALATPELAGVTKADIVVYGQGEDDTLMDVATYSGHFDTLYAAFLGKSWFDHNTLMACIEMPHETAYDGMNAFHSYHHRRARSNVITISTEGLAVESSGVHYTGEALQEIGYNRIWDAWCEWIGNAPTYDVDDERYAYPKPFGVADDLKSHMPVAATSAIDILTCTPDGLRSGTGPFSPLEGKLGWRTLVGSVIASGAIPSDMPGGMFRCSGNVTLESVYTYGYTMTLVNTSGESITVTAKSGGTIATQPSFTLPVPGDYVTLVCFDAEGLQFEVLHSSVLHPTRGIITIADDAVATVKPPAKGGILRIVGNPYSAYPSAALQGLLWYDVGTSVQVSALTVGADVQAVSTDLTGTTGVDGKITVGAIENALKVENRTGASLQLRVVFEA